MALTDKLKAIANAIRGKTGSTDLMTLDEMPTEIENIQTKASAKTPYMEIGVKYETGGGLDLILGATYHGQYIPNYLCDNWEDMTSFMFQYEPDESYVSYGKIGYNAFANCKSLRSVNLPSETTSIGNSAFYNCSALALTSLPDGITSIGTDAFRLCTKLALTSLPDTITSIDYNAFYACSNLAITSLPSSLKTLNNYAFRSCKSLKTITFKSTPTIMHDVVFQNCTNLTTINVPWSEGEVANAPWGATNATINYNYIET